MWVLINLISYQVPGDAAGQGTHIKNDEPGFQHCILLPHHAIIWTVSAHVEATRDPKRMKQREEAVQEIAIMGAISLLLVQTKLQHN